MTKPLRFTKAELANAARIAREQGVAVKLDADGSILVFPDSHKPARVDEPAETSPSAYQKWKERRNADKARGRA